MKPILEVNDLNLFYSSKPGTVRAVDGLSFNLEQGKSLGIVGESGSGKSSLGLALLRLLPKNTERYSGSILVNGVETIDLPEEEFRKTYRWNQISMVFQGAMNSLNPVLSVQTQLAEPLQLTRKYSKSMIQEIVQDSLTLVGLDPKTCHLYPHQLSGGMRQRVVIAMALILHPKIVILDEPTSALDVSLQAQITNLLKRLADEFNLSYVFITHDLGLASDVCDDIGVIYGGQLVEVGRMEQILTDPKHPYSKMLLESLPRLHSKTFPKFIPGESPSLVNPASGCRFMPRCPSAFEACTETPRLFLTTEHNLTRCWLHNIEE